MVIDMFWYGILQCLPPPRCVSTGPVVERLAEMAMNVNVAVNVLVCYE